jgi:formylglycine-generating enzyme required for sulfatase activity
MRITNRSRILNRRDFRLLPLLAVTAIIAWRMGTAAPVSALGTSKVNPKDGLTYVLIPAGTFDMGCSPNDSECEDDEMPHHFVTITKDFWIGQTLVTQAAYKKVIGPNPSMFHGDQLPVDTVSWDDATAYCAAADMRLPTEAEWEFAARGGNPNARYGPLDLIGWYSENSLGTTHEVAKKLPNLYGLYDMLGNIWEWVADWYAPYGAAPAVDPKGPSNAAARALRGGSWSLHENFARASSRSWDVPNTLDEYESFRCAGN